MRDSIPYFFSEADITRMRAKRIERFARQLVLSVEILLRDIFLVV